MSAEFEEAIKKSPYPYQKAVKGMTEEQVVKEQLDFAEWLKDQGLYNMFISGDHMAIMMGVWSLTKQQYVKAIDEQREQMQEDALTILDNYVVGQHIKNNICQVIVDRTNQIKKASSVKITELTAEVRA